MIVILNAKLARLLAAHANKKDGGTEEARQESLLTFIAVFTVHTKMSQLYTFQRSMQANRNVNLW